MSTKQEQLDLLNKEKALNQEDIELQNKQIEGLNQARDELKKQEDQFNEQIQYCNDKIVMLTADNVTIDDVIKIVEAS
jgi:peptidoglycan hydrolase CwlO-like protein